MKRKSSIIIGSVALILIIVVTVMLLANKGFKQEVSQNDPTDIVADFYSAWLDAARSETSSPYAMELDKNPLLSKELRKHLSTQAKNSGTPEVGGEEGEGDIVDPVLCQTAVPTKISTRTVYENEESVQILVTAKDKELSGQSTVTLKRYNDGWYIDQIECSPGEFGVDREFTFEREGALLKDSLKGDFNTDFWHLVFEERGQKGYVALLLFSEASVCADKKGKESPCGDLSQLKETMHLFVQGQMTESGVEVQKAKIVK